MGLCKDNDNSEILNNLNSLKCHTKVSYHENYGADIAPFLSQLTNVSEPIFIKLHSKKSCAGRNKHIGWRSVLVHSLIGSQNLLNNNLNKLLNNNNIGIISNKEFIFKNLERKNGEYIKKMCCILNISYDDVRDSEFIAGTMFMSRTDLFQNLFTKDIINFILKLLSAETGKVNDGYHGTYSHAMERIFTYIIKSSNLSIDYPELEHIFVINDALGRDGLGKLIILNNDHCYIENDINIFGKILQKTDDYIEILWKHSERPVQQKYLYLNNDTLINTKNYYQYINRYNCKSNTDLSIHLISFIKNEELFIKKFLDHHQNIADKITIIDNGSTDNTVNIIKEYINKTNNINLIHYEGHFKGKADICTNIMTNSSCDLLIPLDADEFLVYDDGYIISYDPDIIKKYLQKIDRTEQKYQINKIYNKYPGNNDYFTVVTPDYDSKCDLGKMIFMKSGFVQVDTGFHKGKTKNNKPASNTHILNISYLHYKYTSKEKWIQNTKAKVYARLGDNYENIDELKKYLSKGLPESHCAIAEWVKYLEDGVWCDLQKDIAIKIPIDLSN